MSATIGGVNFFLGFNQDGTVNAVVYELGSSAELARASGLSANGPTWTAEEYALVRNGDEFSVVVPGEETPRPIRPKLIKSSAGGINFTALPPTPEVVPPDVAKATAAAIFGG